MTDDEEREGYDLDDILRDVFHSLMAELADNQTAFAARCSLSQAEISRYLRDAPNDSGNPQQFPISSLTHLCNSIDESPIQVFGRHPHYAEEARLMVNFPKDHLFTQYNSTLRTAEARTLLPMLEQARKVGILGDCVVAVQQIVATAMRAVDKAKARQSVAKRASRKGRRDRARRPTAADTNKD